MGRRAGAHANKLLSKDYGTFSPFTVKAGPRSYVVLRDPVHIRRVLDAPEHLSALPAKVETSEKLFVFPKAASRSALSGASGSEDASLHLSDTDLTSITDAYVSILSSSMHDKMFQVDSWTGIEDFWSFLQLVLLRCTVDTLFGSALLKKYPRLVRDYLQFDVAIEAFIPGMPSMMLIGSTTPRDGLHQGIGSWLKANQSKVHDVEGAVWDKARGSLSIRKHCEAHQPAGDEDLTAKARAAEILSIIHTYVIASVEDGAHAQATCKIDSRSQNKQRACIIHLLVHCRNTTEVPPFPQHDN